MCQQWLSVVGLILELVGFLLIVREWYRAFAQMVALRQQAVREDYIRARKAQGQPYEDALLEQEAGASMWRNTQKENRIDNRRRFRTFTIGVALVVLGVVGQILGSLPHVPFGIVLCQ